MRLTEDKLPVYFIIILTIYLILGWINLACLPVVWTDEVMNLDPALQWHKHGHYAGFLWPNKGSDTLFLSYPPLIQFWHILMLCFLPFDIFWMRLPFLIIHLFTWVFLFRITKKNTGNAVVATLLLICLFVFDKVVFELSRSMRVEVIETFLVALLLFLAQRKKRGFLPGILLGLLAIAHLKMWPFIFIWIVYDWVTEKWSKNFMLMIFGALIPVFLFLLFIDFRLADLWSQMFSQAEKHAASGNVFFGLYENFFGKFWPVYKEQPWVIGIWFIMLWSSLTQLLKSRGRGLEAWLFLGTWLAWFFVLAPHYRYLPPLYLTGIVVLSRDQRISGLFKTSRSIRILIFLLPFLTTGFFMRHIMAIYQRNERDNHRVENWILNTIPQKKKILLVGNAAGFYLTKDSSLDYGMDMYPQNLHPEKYDHVYFLTKENPGLTQIARYDIHPRKLPGILAALQSGETYAGLAIYEIKNTEEWKKLTDRYQNDY